MLGILSLFGVILGRTICGWLCPLGLIQELLHKIPTPKIKKSRVTRALSWLKYIVLAVFVVAIPLWYGLKNNLPLPGFCKYICPAGTLEGAMGLLSNPANSEKFSMLGILFTRKFVIMLIIGLLCVFIYRSFCRFLCPLGAIYGLFNRFNVIGVKVDEDRCNHCGSCVCSCGMDVRHVGDHECINCAKCMDVCSRKAISIKAGSYAIKAPEGGCADDNDYSEADRRHFVKLLWGVALGLLCVALLWFNFLDPSVRKRVSAVPAPTPTAAAPAGEDGVPAKAEAPADAAAPVSYDSSAPIGYNVGQQLADFTAATFDGGEFRLADTRGKIVFINLWGTYCTPCVQELPSFEALYEKHPDEVAMLAVHSSLTGEVEPQDYVAEKGWNSWMLPFALDDEDNDTIFTVVNGSTTLPQTIVLNRRGEVIYNRVGSVTQEMLDALYRQADESVSGGTPGAAAATETPQSSAPAVYQVIVSDKAGQPVPGTTVLFCSENECVLGETDADGIASFGSEAGAYTVHIQKVPEGYAKDKTEYLAPEEPGPVTIVLQADSAVAAQEQPVDEKDESYYVIDRPTAGFHFVVPEKYRNLNGSLSFDSHPLDDGILHTTSSYYAFPTDEFDAYDAFGEAWFNAILNGEEPPEPPDPLWMTGCECVYLFDYFVINGDRGEEELRASLKESNGVRGDDFRWLEKLGSDGEFSFFLGQYSELDELMDRCRDVLDEKYFSELEELVNDRETYINALTLKAPVADRTALEVGDVVSFETTDLDGNPVNSKDLFAGRKVTMINLWATWCFACKKELPELSELAKKCEEMGCQIVGICLDADEEDLAELAREILKSNGADYLNLVPPENTGNLLPTISYPTSFFFDSEGRMIVEPVRGAHVDQDLAALNAALEKIGAE